MTTPQNSPERGAAPLRRAGRGPAQRAQREKIQKQLDEALADSFPASDPVAIVTSQEEEDWGPSEGPPARAPGPGPGRGASGNPPK